MSASPHGFPLDVRDNIVSFLNLFMLVQMTAITKDIIPETVRRDYAELLAAARGLPVVLADVNHLTFSEAALDLWQDVAKIVGRMEGKEILLCPGFQRTAVISVKFLGRGGTESVSEEAVREKHVGPKAMKAASLLEETFREEIGPSDFMTDDADVSAALAMLQRGAWTYDLYPARFGESARGHAVLRFRVFGIVGFVVLTERAAGVVL